MPDYKTAPKTLMEVFAETPPQNLKSPKPHPLAHQVPGWVEMLLHNPGLKTEYFDYLQSLLDNYRDKQDSADDMVAFAKLRGAIEVIKQQLSFITNWMIEKKRRETHHDD